MGILTKKPITSEYDSSGIEITAVEIRCLIEDQCTSLQKDQPRHDRRRRISKLGRHSPASQPLARCILSITPGVELLEGDTREPNNGLKAGPFAVVKYGDV